MTTIHRVELPGVFFDNLVEDAVPTTIDETPVLINLDPEPLEIGILKGTDIQLDIATIDSSGSIDLSNTSVYVNGVIAFQAGTFQTGFTGPDSQYLNIQSDVLRIVVDPLVDFLSQATVLVRVVTQAVSSGGVLDTTYQFSIADTTAPAIVSADAIELQRIRIVFTESVMQGDEENPASSLNPADWQLDRLGDYITPIVSAIPVRIVAGAALNTVDLYTDIPLTPGGTYRLTAVNLEDSSGNTILAPDNTASFTGWQPPVPAGRLFDLYGKLPEINRREDDTLDLLRFVGCLQEVANLLLYDIDRFVDQLDPDTATEDAVDVMLADLGNPFSFDLQLVDKRRLLRVLVDMYRLKGTAPGIISVVRFFLAFEISIDAFNLTDGWILGESELGFDTVLATDDPALLYSFRVIVQQLLTDAQRSQLQSIIRYMKPTQTHFVQLVEPTPPDPVILHMELGLSLLGENWLLH